MNLSEFAAAALLSLSSWLNVHPLPSQNSDIWSIEQSWQKQQDTYRFTASSQVIPEHCRTQLQGYIEFPVVIHGAHEVFLDGQILDRFGDPSFRSVRSFYGTLVLNCSQLMHGKTLTWRAYSYSQYFARIAFWPNIQSASPSINIYQETLNAVVSGGLLTLALISIFVFWKQVSHHLTISLVGSGLAFAAYFIATTPAFFNLNIPMLTLHKLADFSLWVGTLLLFNVFRFNGLFGKTAYAIYGCHVILAVMVISFGQTGDVIQLGTTIPFVPFFCLMGLGLVNLLRRAKNRKIYRTSILQVISLSSFIFISVNDLLVVLGLFHGPVLLSIGVLGGISFLALGVHEKIVEAYRERDYLRHHLEDEVANKTSEICAKTAALEFALSGLRVAQADLIQSSKMASLGMLAAGIAHEINNSLNYVNGSIMPLKRLLQKTSNFEYAEKAQALLQIMQDGLHLTFDIMNSLRTFSGLNQANIKDQFVLDLVRSTLTILNNRIPAGIHIEIDIPSSLEISVNAAAINQVLMNLIVNSLDALGEHGQIKISAIATNESVTLCVHDNGPGIPTHIRDRVFDPFFTTKDVGKGTGLGLHISRREILRHGGSLKLDPHTVEGSTFTITLPKHPLGEDAACNQ